jgi:hypothetical protein
MKFVDANGRVFGRVNLVDAAVLAFVGMLIPLAYASYLLFRSPPATITSVEPSKMELGRNPRVRISGTNLRPFMRVAFNDLQGRPFMIGSTTTAEVDLPELEPGVYDVILYDYAQELSRLPKALEILEPVPAAMTQLVATGQFIGLSKAHVGSLRKGMPFASVQRPNSAELLAWGDATMATARVRTGDTLVSVGLDGQYQVPAAVRLACWFENNPDGSLRCVTSGRTQGVTVTRDAVLNLQREDGEYFNFQVSEVFPAEPPQFMTVRVRAGLAAALAEARPGDRDMSGPPFDGAWVGTVVGVNNDIVTLRLPVQRVVDAWQYRAYALKVGRSIRFETEAYVIDGVVLELGEPLAN